MATKERKSISRNCCAGPISARRSTVGAQSGVGGLHRIPTAIALGCSGRAAAEAGHAQSTTPRRRACSPPRCWRMRKSSTITCWRSMPCSSTMKAGSGRANSGEGWRIRGSRTSQAILDGGGPHARASHAVLSRGAAHHPCKNGSRPERCEGWSAAGARDAGASDRGARDDWGARAAAIARVYGGGRGFLIARVSVLARGARAAGGATGMDALRISSPFPLPWRVRHGRGRKKPPRIATGTRAKKPRNSMH